MITAAKPHLTLSGRCSECGRAQVRQATDGRGEVIDVPDPCVHFRARRAPPEPKSEPRIPLRAPTAEPKEEDVSTATKKLGADEMKEQIRTVLAAQPELSQSDARRTIEERAGCAAINPGTFHGHWRAVRKELGMGAAPKGTAKPRAQDKKAEKPAKKEEAPAPVAAPAATDGDVVQDKEPALLEESRSLRATYEAGEFVRIEEERGLWSLRVSLDFQTRGDALNALTGLLGLVE